MNKYVVETYYKKHAFINGYEFNAVNNLTALAHISYKLRIDNYGIKKAKIKIIRKWDEK